MQEPFDVVVIGAGAAGLAAAARLSHTPLSVAVLEAQDRIGGRAHTLVTAPDLALDLGCGWLHSADQNPLTALFAQNRIPVDETPAAWSRPDANLSLSPEQGESFRAEMKAFEDRLAKAARGRGPDRASVHLARSARWRPMLEAFSSYYNGARLSRISARDYEAYEDTGVNWRAPGGYGAGICALSDPYLIVRQAEVSAIDHSGRQLELETKRGRIVARTVIVTVSSALLAREAIAFNPPLPDKTDAAIGLPLGLANKVFLALETPEAFPEEHHLWGSTRTPDTGSYYLRPLGRPVIEAYFGGDLAHSLESEGPGAAAAFAQEELARAFGAYPAGGLHVMAETRWGQDPFALGAYSHALPGCAEARADLARPVDDRIFFAGEATSAHAFSTAHGAWESGLRAAEEALAALARSA